jgi:hypothetical protein
MKTQTKTRINTKILSVLAVFFISGSCHATTLARLSLEQLAGTADAVARVRCAGSESHWENGSIWTVSTFDVIEIMKGTLPAQVTVRLPGGRVGHLIVTVDGTPKFSVGNESVLFLERSRAGGFAVAGWVEGTFRVAIDPITRRETVTQDSSAFAVFDAASRSFKTEGIRRMPIEQFRARIAAAVASTEEKAR